ncbi:MAG: transporter [Planctomycetota bacterium]|nr:transporter [Planctomycetota bacterium]
MRCSGVVTGLAVLVFAAAAWAGETEHYINGLEGIKCASVPPPGIYYRNYDLWYHASELHDRNGKNVDLGFNLDVVASAQRAIWVTDRIKDIIGCDFGMHAVVPFVYQDVKMSRIGVDDQRIRVGDIFVCPVLLSWHKKRFDLALDYELVMPTGDLDRSEPATPGKEFWTHLFTFGGTGYLDEEKTWTVSLLSRYEIHSEKRNAHITPGHDFHFEWGVGKAFKKGFEVGAVGYCQWQLTDDQGSGVYWGHSKDRVYGAGAEANYFIKTIKLHASLRFIREFGARDRPEGNMTMLTLTKRF